MGDVNKKFTLLSKVAMENKYAQEYLGLLARRGDIGSIRIGKRWYTKIEWFSEFLADAEARKAETKTLVFPAMPIEEKIEQKKEIMAKETAPLERIEEHPVRVVKISEARQKEIVSGGKAEATRISVVAQKDPMREKEEIKVAKKEEVKIILPKVEKPKPIIQKAFVVGKKLGTINLKINRNAKPALWKATANIPKIKKTILEKKSQSMRFVDSPAADSWLNKAGEPSPNFVPVAPRTGFFPKFAFSMSVVLLLVLLIQFGWVYKNELKGAVGIGSGKVAGAQDSKANLDIVRNSSANYLGKQEEKLKEKISLSRVLVRAAVERSNDQLSVTNDQ